MLVSSNAPEWGMSYFGVLKAGATCIPCDPESSTAEILNFARAGNAAGMICSQAVIDDHPDLQERSSEQGLTRCGRTTKSLRCLTKRLKTNASPCCRSARTHRASLH